MLIKITVTKEIYRQAMMCGVGPEYQVPEIFDELPWPAYKKVSENCAISLAVREIAPKAKIGMIHIIWDTRLPASLTPKKATEMINVFDTSTPFERLLLPEFSFEVDFPDALVEQIGIDQVKEILKNSETLQIA